MALTSITVTTGVSVNGRVLARNGAVTLDTNTITKPAGALSITYSAGPATTTTGDATFTPGPPGNLGSTRTAFSASDGTGSNSATWNPTITVTLPPQVIAGTYGAVITHSVS